MASVLSSRGDAEVRAVPRAFTVGAYEAVAMFGLADKGSEAFALFSTTFNEVRLMLDSTNDCIGREAGFVGDAVEL